MFDYVTGRDTKAEELLWLLNGQQTVPLNEISFVVITGTYTPRPSEPQEWPFERGEIIPVQSVAAVWEGGRRVRDEYEVEVFGKGRSFEPWDMFHARYDTHDILEAVEVARFAANGEDGFYERFHGHWRLRSDQVEAEQEWCSNLEPLRIGDYPRQRS